ncbi:MAG: carboxy terminal-processing peptidase [Bacteroidetes bacterium]|nr:carboxy terminal-processing peptidase [Bacteroidota bacterium]
MLHKLLFEWKKPVLLFFCLTIVPLFTFSQTESQKRYAEQAFMVAKVLEKYHYKPQVLNNDLSAKLHSEFIQSLDPSGIYFTKSDIQQLKKWDDLLDDEIRNRSTNYLAAITDLYKKRLLHADSIITAIGEKPFNFNEKDTIHFLNKKADINYSVDDKALVKRWTKWMKYQTLEMLYTPKDKDEDPFTMDPKDVLKKEAEVRAKIVTRNKRTIKRILENSDGYENYMSSQFINKFVSIFDPHTSFFSASEKQDFESSISTSELSFGFYFNENETGEIEIVYLTPGGSAWKSNQLHKGDIILKVKPKDGKQLDLTAVSSEEATELMYSFNDNEAEFTIRKTNGQIKDVSLIKSKVRSDENVVKSYILNGEKKVGYISLPSFYTEWENNNPLGCANDVAKEIVKLQEENIEALIIDLRYNGGGSVHEAMGLIGLFINEGPLCIFKIRNEKPVLLKDMNRGTAYNGPMAIMVNGMSASASEIFSATLQDYNRAVLVGSSTYGKSTGQIIIPLDTTYSLPEVISGALTNTQSSLGYIKITTDGFYRVTNATHQKKGVMPDVPLLEPYFYTDYKESASPYALSNDSIVKKVIYVPLSPLPLLDLNTKSRERVSQNTNFKRLNTINDSLKSMSNLETAIILSPQFFKKNEKIIQLLQEEMEQHLYDSSKTYVVANHLYDKKVIDFDEFTKEINTRSLETIQTDIYIEETYYVLKDLITFIKN